MKSTDVESEHSDGGIDEEGNEEDGNEKEDEDEDENDSEEGEYGEDDLFTAPSTGDELSSEPSIEVGRRQESALQPFARSVCPRLSGIWPFAALIPANN